jgi:DNA-binding NarL/FixJ family response regulator
MKTRVIIVDDHTIVRNGLRLILETSGDIKIIGEAGDGLEAIQLVNADCPDVILMDIGMPNLNGIDASRLIKEQHPSVRIVILSMQSSSEDIFRAFQAGATGYLLKESAGTEVIEAVLAAHAGRRYLSRKVDDIVIDSYIQERRVGEKISPLESLSSREREVLQLVVEGRSSKDIAAMLYLSDKTIDTYRSRLMQKLGIFDIPSLVKFALQHGLTKM